MKKILVFYFVTVLLLFLLLIYFKAFHPPNKETLTFTDSPLNYCSSRSDCYIHRIDNCGCEKEVVVNSKYKGTSELSKEFPDTPSEECEVVCAPGGIFAKRAFCIDNKCGIEWARMKE